MGSPLRIVDGAGVQVNLYDSTNGLYNLGYIHEDGVEFMSENQKVVLSDGNLFDLSNLTSFSIPCLQSDTAGLIAEIATRRGTLQEVYIIGNDVAVKISAVLLAVQLQRNFKGGEPHRVVITGSVHDDAQVTVMHNILGSNGACGTDAGSGIATGWTNDGGSSASVDTSHLGGGYGNEQRITLSDSGDSIYCRVALPLDQLQVKLTASVYVHNYKAGTSYFYLSIRTRNTANTVVDTESSSEISIAAEPDARHTSEKVFTPSANCYYVELAIIGSDTGTAELGFDNAQLELGEITAYTDGQ